MTSLCIYTKNTHGIPISLVTCICWAPCARASGIPVSQQDQNGDYWRNITVEEEQFLCPDSGISVLNQLVAPIGIPSMDSVIGNAVFHKSFV